MTLAASGMAIAAFAASSGGWGTVEWSRPTNGTAYFQAIDCSSITDCWAVGILRNPGQNGGYQTLTEHWNGNSWSPVASPNVNTTQEHILNGVSCPSSTRCWAVGYYGGDGTGVAQTLIEKWNGTAWKIVASPNSNSQQYNFLNDITCISNSECWAVGYFSAGGVDYTLVLKWNGTAWRIIASPNVASPFGNRLEDVTCLSSSDCWAVGEYWLPSGHPQTLTQHWNGNAWTIVSSPNPVPADGVTLSGIACTSASQCWAVGRHTFLNGPSTLATNTLIEKWDGSSWTIVPSPSTRSTQNYLTDVTCAADAECWAVGWYADNYFYPLIQQWDGRSWSLAPNDSMPGELEGVACASTSRCWAVGTVTIQAYNPTITLDSVTRDTAGRVSLTGRTVPNFSVDIQAAQNLATPFTNIGRVTSGTDGTFRYDDTSLPTEERFYRASHP